MDRWIINRGRSGQPSREEKLKMRLTVEVAHIKTRPREVGKTPRGLQVCERKRKGGDPGPRVPPKRGS